MVYFKNLNSLRFLAAFMVMLHHFELSNGVQLNTYYGRFVEIIGKLGVVLFFTLSGFLITYLLLLEKEQTSKISIKNFYRRRILRIWPLYYLIVLGALFVFNNVPYIRVPYLSDLYITQHFTLKCFLFIFMLPNVANSFGLLLPFADQCWSIGVEEQFYLFWPFLFRRSTNPLRPLVWVIVIYLIIKGIIDLFFKDASLFITLLSFDTMAIGGIFAILLYQKDRILDFIFRKGFQVILFILLPSLIIFFVHFGFLHFEVYSLLFGLSIVIFAGPRPIISLENTIVNYLGKISYGLYMYHFLAIRLCDVLEIKLVFLKNYHFVKFVVMFLLTFLLATTSYELFEKRFIKRKVKFSAIISGDNVVDA